MAEPSWYFQLVEAFAQAIAAQQGQQLFRMPGHRSLAGWKTRGADGVPDITIHWKRSGLDLEGAPPRIVCVAVGGDFGEVDQPGGGRATRLPVGALRENALAVRRFGIQVYVWGQDDAQSEALYHNALRAWHHLFSDGEQPGKPPVFSAEVWEDQQPNAGGQTTHGSMVSFFVTWELVVKDTPSPLIIVKQITNKLYFDGAPSNPEEAEYVLVPR